MWKTNFSAAIVHTESHTQANQSLQDDSVHFWVAFRLCLMHVCLAQLFSLFYSKSKGFTLQS